MEKTGHDSDAIISPSRNKGELFQAPNALMVMIPSELQYLVRLANAEPVPLRSMPLSRIYGTSSGEYAMLTLSGPFMGAPQAAAALEKLIALGSKRILILGWCGSLQPDLKVGDIVLPSCALSEEGTSAHYPTGEQTPEPDLRLTRTIEEALNNGGIPFQKGPVWTTDAVYRETKQKVAAYGKRGILAVEMEFSALMTVARYRSVALAGLLVVSDELFELKWRPGFSNPILKQRSRVAGALLLRLAAAET